MDSQRGVKTPVDLLVSYCESHHLSPPNYQFVRSSTSQLRAPRFFCNVQVGGHAYDTSSDFACQSDAKQAAARVALNSINGNGEGQSSEAKRPEGDFKSVWGDLWMPYWTNYEILMERFRFLGGFTWAYVLNEIAKVNNLPVPLKFTFKGSDGAFIAQLSFLGRVFTSTCPKETDRDAKQEVSKLIVLSLLGRNKGRDAVQPSRGFVNFRTSSSVRVASPQVWEARPTTIAGVTGTDASASTGRMLYAEVAKLKSSVVETAAGVQQGTDEEKAENSSRISSSPDIFNHRYNPISRPSHPVLSDSISPSLAVSSLAICHPSQSIPVSTSAAHDFITPFKPTTSRHFVDGAFHVNTQPASQVCSIFDSLTTQLEALHLPHHVSEAAQTITALNFSSGSLASSSYDKYHQNAAQSISGDEQTYRIDEQNYRIDEQNYRIDAESVANLQVRLIGSSSGSRDTSHFPQIPAPPKLAPPPSFLDSELHLHGDTLGLRRLTLPQLPQVISTPHPPIFAPQLHSHSSSTWPPAHDAAAMQHSHSHSHPLPMHHSPLTFSHAPPHPPPYPSASGFLPSTSSIHNLSAYNLSRVPSSMSSQTYTPHLAGFSPFQAPQFQNAALSGTQHALGPQQTLQQLSVHPAATDSPSLRLARLLRVNYPYLPSPQYSQQQTITGEMVATVAVGSLGTFVSRRRNGSGRGVGGPVGSGEQEVAIGDLMEDAAAVALENIRFQYV